MKKRINDLVIKMANVNGTGSASANALLTKAIFRMGIPVVGKNYFPSNIQGLPTWYEVRVNGDGYLARAGHVDISVAMNAQTYTDDLAEVASGGYLIYDSTWPRAKQLQRDDISIIGIPLARMVNEHVEGARARILMKNIAYVGVLGALLGIDHAVVKTLLEETFASKPQLVDANLKVIDLGWRYAVEHFDCPLPIHLEAADRTNGHILMEGNAAIGLGALYAGATVASWYPITPSTSVMDTFTAFCDRYRRDEETGERSTLIIQAEDELAAMGMVLGASWNGARAFTATSGPGVSLMNEFLGFGYYAEIPAVLVDVQRVGPSTGMPTRTQQSDILEAAYASHGDTRHVVLFPADPSECFSLTINAFDLAERLQTPVILLSDLDIGMNDWMIPELEWDDSYKPDRGKVFTADELEKLDVFHRYHDADGDGIPRRSLPGIHSRGAYFTRGSGHTWKGSYTEKGPEYQDLLDRLVRKFDHAATLVPKPVVSQRKGLKTAVLTIGSCNEAVREALDRLAREGTELNFMRVRAFPFGREVEQFIAAHDRIFVIEQNRDAQLRSLLLLETEATKAQLIPILHYDGMPLSAGFVIDAINQALSRGAVA